VFVFSIIGKNCKRNQPVKDAIQITRKILCPTTDCRFAYKYRHQTLTT